MDAQGRVVFEGRRIILDSDSYPREFGRWGNAETTPGPGGDARDLGFRMIYCLTTSGDAVYVSDKDLRRIAKIEMEYREAKEAQVP